MTTAIKVDAHAGWPVRVITLASSGPGEWVARETIVPAHTEQTFYVHSGMCIHRIEEVQPNEGS